MRQGWHARTGADSADNHRPIPLPRQTGAADDAEVGAVCDRIIRMRDGVIVGEGRSGELAA
jgi:hypothetical protein